jgi:hypothetical protein
MVSPAKVEGVILASFAWNFDSEKQLLQLLGKGWEIQFGTGLALTF